MVTSAAKDGDVLKTPKWSYSNLLELTFSKALQLLDKDENEVEEVYILNDRIVRSSYTDRIWQQLNNKYHLPRGFLESHCLSEDFLKVDESQLPLWPILPGPFTRDRNQLLTRPSSSPIFHAKFPEKAKLYDLVCAAGVPNYRGSRITLPTGLPLDTWKQRLKGYADFAMIQFMEFGWPASFESSEKPDLDVDNHLSAELHKASVAKYIQKEVEHNALVGPFPESPFNWLRVNPMMTRAKKDPGERRVILDLSFPDGAGVNSFIPKTLFDGGPYKLRLPTAIQFANLIAEMGAGCWLTKMDLSRAYRQLPMDPFDWALLGIHWENSSYFDSSVSFGLRHGAMYCERVTQAICHLCWVELVIMALAYIDDIVTACNLTFEEACRRYQLMLWIVRSLGLTLAENKCEGPRTQMVWIGVFFDSIKMFMAINRMKIEECLQLCRRILDMEIFNQFHLDSLIGTLIHCTKFTPCGRKFLNRILFLKRENWDATDITWTDDARKDVLWFIYFLERFNGVGIIRSFITANSVVESDACLVGGGATWNNSRYFKLAWPESVKSWSLAISEFQIVVDRDEGQDCQIPV